VRAAISRGIGGPGGKSQANPGLICAPATAGDPGGPPPGTAWWLVVTEPELQEDQRMPEAVVFGGRFAPVIPEKGLPRGRAGPGCIGGDVLIGALV
jgi:hypothetical protein